MREGYPPKETLRKVLKKFVKLLNGEEKTLTFKNNIRTTLNPHKITSNKNLNTKTK